MRASAPVYDPGAPCTITVELNTTDQADPYRHRAGVTVAGPRTIEATADTWWDAWRALYLTDQQHRCARPLGHDGVVAVDQRRASSSGSRPGAVIGATATSGRVVLANIVPPVSRTISHCVGVPSSPSW